MTVFSSFKDEQAVQFLTGGSSKNGIGHKVSKII
jgi:hypothetical protein